MTQDVFLLGIAALLLSGGQILWKVSATKVVNVNGLISIVEKLLGDFHFIAGCILYLLATGLWIYLLGKYEYSKIYPVFVGLCVLMSLVVGQIILQENGNFIEKFAGSALIIIGVGIVVRS